MNLPPLQQHVQRFTVNVQLEQRLRSKTTVVPARTAREAVDRLVEGGAREAGFYDWIRISCDNESSERPRHADRGGDRRD